MKRVSFRTKRVNRLLRAGQACRSWVALVLVILTGACTARGDAKIVSIGGLKTSPVNNARFTGGQGGVAATTYLGIAKGKPAMQDPKAGSPFDDTKASQILDPKGNGVKALNGLDVTKLGQAFGTVYGIPKNTLAIDVGRSLQYNVKTTPDKIADAKAAKPPLATTAGVLAIGKNTAQSTATISAVMNADKKTATISGSVSAEVNKDVKNPQVGFAAAIVHDPVTFVQDSLGMPASVQVSIGSGFMLKADQPGDFAGAFVDLETDRDGALFNFGVQIDSTTTALTASDFVVDAQTGFASNDAFINQFLLTAFTLTDHTLTLANPADLTLATITQNDSTGAPLTVTWNYGGFAGTVPEPSGLLLLGLGLARLGLSAAIRWARAGGAAPEGSPRAAVGRDRAGP